MRRIALLCPFLIGTLNGLPGCLEAQHGGQGEDAKATSQPLATTPPPDTTPTSHPPDTTSASNPPDTTPTSQPADTTPTSEPPDTEVPPDTAPECANAGTVCMMQNACCAGLVCTGGPYAYGECMLKQPLHAYCEDERWCSSGACADGECVNPGCAANGTVCESTECCSGLCLHPTDSYGPAVCTAPQPPGAGCSYDAMCASGACVDGACAAPTCVARGDACWFDGACCVGDFCTQNGQSYVVGICLGKRGDGGDCEVDSWCRSGHCVDGFCRTL